MSLILDDREDTALFECLTKTYDFPVIKQHLEFGDALWEGNGPDGPCMVGVERKRLNDIVNSMTSGRLVGHQLRGMWECYDYIYLLIEDIFQPGKNGEMEIWRNGKWMPLWSVRGEACTYRQIQAFLNGLVVASGVALLRTSSTRETAALYAALYHWWQKKFKEHRSIGEIYAPGPDVPIRRGKASLLNREPGLTEKLAAQLPGVDRKAWDIGRNFKTPREFMEFAAFSGVREWAQMRGIAKDGAEQIIAALDKERV
jgi:ERCC4-type nuclease